MQTDQTVIPVYLQQQFVLTALRHRPTHQPQISVCVRQQTDGTAAELQPTQTPGIAEDDNCRGVCYGVGLPPTHSAHCSQVTPPM